MGSAKITPAITPTVGPDASPKSHSCVVRQTSHPPRTTAARIQASSPISSATPAPGRITAMWLLYLYRGKWRVDRGAQSAGGLRRLVEAVRKASNGGRWRADSVWARCRLRPAARLGTPASSLSDEMPIGLQKGIVMTMLRDAGSLKNDKKFNMREIVIDTETTGLDPLSTAPARRFHQPGRLYVLGQSRNPARIATTLTRAADDKDDRERAQCHSVGQSISTRQCEKDSRPCEDQKHRTRDCYSPGR